MRSNVTKNADIFFVRKQLNESMFLHTFSAICKKGMQEFLFFEDLHFSYRYDMIIFRKGVVKMTITNRAENRRTDRGRLIYLTLAGVFAAMIYLLTAFVKVPTGAGYTHAGDSAVFLAACILPAPYAAAAAAIGAGLADGLGGFVVWLPATLVIKALAALCFTSKKDTIINKRNILALIPALVLCAVGYSLYQGIFMSGGISKTAFAAAFAQIPAYCVQTGIGAAIFITAGTALDRMKIKRSLAKKTL